MPDRYLDGILLMIEEADRIEPDDYHFGSIMKMKIIWISQHPDQGNDDIDNRNGDNKMVLGNPDIR